MFGVLLLLDRLPTEANVSPSAYRPCYTAGYSVAPIAISVGTGSPVKPLLQAQWGRTGHFMCTNKARPATDPTSPSLPLQ